MTGRSPDMRDARVPQADQVAGRAVGGVTVVDKDALRFETLNPPRDNHHRHLLRDHTQLLVRNVTAYHDHPVALSLQNHLERAHLVALVVRAPVRGCEHRSIPRPIQPLLNSGNDPGKERATDILDHHTDGHRAAARESPRHLVRPVLQLFDSRQHKRPLIDRHWFCAVEYSGNGAGGDTGLPRNVLNCDALVHACPSHSVVC